MNLTMGEVAAVLGASSGVADRLVEGYSIDSRSILPGQLFFAIRGPRFDGHQFVAQALEGGAAGAVVEENFYASAPVEWRPQLITVVDTHGALQRLARDVRRKWGKRLFAVTGSTGKSTTKEMIAAILSRRFRVLRSPGNLNNDFGLPLALLGLEPEHEVAVMELAMSAAGEIGRLARLAEPDVGVITNVAPAHLQFFDSVDAIALAKRELIDYLATTGPDVVAVLNEDDERVRKFAEGFPGRVLTFGFSEKAAFRAADVQPAVGIGSAFRVIAPEWESEFTLPLPGRHNIQNALAAIAAAGVCAVPPEETRQALAEFQNLHQRSEILTLPRGITIINDCYNSNPLAMERMLEALAVWPGARRRIVVAGEMLELGPTSPELHRGVGRICAQSGVSWLIAVRGDARFFVEGAVEEGIPSSHGKYFPDAKLAGEFCQTLIAPDDVILVKGSRAVHLETVIEMLKRQNPGVRSQEPEGRNQNPAVRSQESEGGSQ
ncbi:MAG: UDP-N-acetylmuramoyl-tripeptide--D-alanyl-D-alanine ligase [Terriglobia bacterium]